MDRLSDAVAILENFFVVESQYAIALGFEPQLPDCVTELVLLQVMGPAV